MEKSIYDIEERKRIILFLSIALGGFLFYAMRGMFSAFLGAIVLYTIFRPLFAWFTEKAGFRTWVTSLIILLLSFVIIVFPFSLIIMMIFNKANDCA